ncbi:hypothetical protein SAMN06265182_1331 [Persephonella hydrogeniphila]|uniref:Uncharacterized protein n=1 Tax=Persephonella hydrogeniphila TaxID=198703 RepID=A0A285NGE3_9AQUI|nr:hypothetical protein [Persephonella hydrogeniphila]SNZ08525.1 hypothetical protein SAMN06265182_1331 [Persephonella hydrogeniphila]
MGREIIEEFESEKGIKVILEYDNEKETYIMTIYKDTGKIVFQGSMKEIQQQAEKYFVKSLKDIKNKMEIALLEDLFNR